jgi:predicted sugar kinase
VLVRPAQSQGLAGERELAAFAKLPSVADEVTRELWRITNKDMLPAIEARNCARFGEAVYRYGRLAGECFAPAQGGPFASQQIEALVERIRAHGVAGVGQSSWGPTVFAIVPTERDGDALAQWLRSESIENELEIEIAAPDNSGANVSKL